MERNVEFLRSRSAPNNIFFNVEPFDGRLAAFEDGASWPELLSRYDIADDVAGFLRLDRRPVARGYSFSPFLRTTIHLGERLKIDNPDNAMLWAHLDLDQTIAGRIAGMLLKLPLLRLDVVLRDGTARSFRIMPAAAREGFLLSPVVDSRLDFAALGRADLATLMAAKQVDRMVISPQCFATSAYRAEVPITIEKPQWAGSSPAIGSKLEGEVRRGKPRHPRCGREERHLSTGLHRPGPGNVCARGQPDRHQGPVGAADDGAVLHSRWGVAERKPHRRRRVSNFCAAHRRRFATAVVTAADTAPTD
jgi:hypothetical protein